MSRTGGGRSLAVLSLAAQLALGLSAAHAYLATRNSLEEGGH